MSSSSNSPCAACKFLRRKCTQECVFAPYFPADQPQRFANVHKVFGASNVAKLLNELAGAQREDAVNSLAYEAESRLRDPVYGCVGLISLLQQRLKQVQSDLITAKKEMATYIGPSALMAAAPMFPTGGYNAVANANVMGGYNMGNMMVGPSHQNAQQLMAVAMKEEQDEMMRNWEQQQQQFMRFNSGGSGSGSGGFCGMYEVGGGANVDSPGGVFNQMGSPSLALQPPHADVDEPLGQLLLLQQPESQQQTGQIAQAIPLHSLHQQPPQQPGQHLMLHHHHHHHIHHEQREHDHQQHEHHHHQRSGSEEERGTGTTNVAPSC
ncbi:uncharacterized protein LOC141622276 [Silene latifolia]|uniref:uncharacterized protein LOC141622276 n=1 Tax=Silene latifolia TaxID=37657 RepID=UPI003D7749FF